MLIDGQQTLRETTRIKGKGTLPRSSYRQAAVLGNGTDKGASLSLNEHHN